MLNKLKKMNPFIFILAFFVISIALIPYWFAGKFSAMGWYDEVSIHLPWNHIFLRSSSHFLQGFSGGIGKDTAVVVDQISLYRFLLKFLEEWQAALLIRFLNLTFFFTGSYFIGVHIFKRSSFFCFAASFFTLFSTYIVYGWTIGGHLFDLSILSFIILILFSEIPIPTKQVLSVIGGVVFPFFVAPIFISVFLVFFLLFLYLLLGKQKFFRNFNWRVFITFFVIFHLFLAFNWQNILVVIAASKEGVRFQMGQNSTISFLELVKTSIEHFNVWLQKFSNKNILYALMFFIVFSNSKNKFLRLTITFFTIFLLPIFLKFSARIINIPIFSTYRWDIVWLLLPLCILYLFYEDSSISKGLLKFISISFFLSIGLYSLKIFADYSFDGLIVKGGWGISSQYTELSSMGTSFRFISDYRTLDWSIPQYYGLRSFDGYEASKPVAREYFIQHSLYLNEDDAPKSSYAHSYFFFPKPDEDLKYNVKGFEIANVKFILSRQPHIKGLNDPSFKLPGKDISDLPDSIVKKIVQQIYGSFWLFPELYVYELSNPWHWFFTPQNIRVSKYTTRDKEFYQEILDLPYEGMLVSADFNKKLSDLNVLANKTRIVKSNISGDQFHFLLNKQNGFIILNQIYSKKWTAFCDEKTLDLFPVNAIMMAVAITKNCENLTLSYNY